MEILSRTDTENELSKKQSHFNIQVNIGTGMTIIRMHRKSIMVRGSGFANTDR